MKLGLILFGLFFSSTLFASSGGRDNTALFPQPTPDTALGARPATPELVAPAFNAKTGGENVELKWNAVKNANGYHLQVARDPNFKWLIAEQNPMKETSFTATGLEKGKTYYWRVAAYTLGNATGRSKGWFSQSSFR